MTRKVAYWVSTGVLAALSVFAAFTYLLGSPQTVQEFAHVGYPQQLRIILGIAKLLGAITLVVFRDLHLLPDDHAEQIFAMAEEIAERVG
jgi:DoxX-like family